jgi:Na+-transporting NADH:ubiquinone oxidoreductase subunit A
MLIKVRHGLDLTVPGKPEQVVYDAAPPAHVALVGSDYPRLKPALTVKVGQSVRLGETLFTARACPAIRYTAPASGRVAAIHRGRKRRLLSVVIEIDPDAPTAENESWTPDELSRLERSIVTQRLLETGLWTAFRARPFDANPDPSIEARAIFVTAIDSRPLAADPAAVILAQRAAFANGLTALSRLCGRVYLCTAPSARFLDAPVTGVRQVEFAGPHPSGLPGTHIHELSVVGNAPDLWHIGYQDVIAIGSAFTTGRIMNERIVAVGGPGARRPRLLRTRLGACLGELLRDELAPGHEAISGSVLDGRRPEPACDYLGRYDTQISAVAAGDGAARTGAVSARAAATDGMLSVEAFERIWPFDLPPLPLLRALLCGDAERAQALGCLELGAEDLALCSYVCPAKHDYAAALAANLELLDATA